MSSICDRIADDERDTDRRFGLSPTSPKNPKTAWHYVAQDGLPPCDGETVYVGYNSAGFSCCFNRVYDDGLCLMGGPESCTAQMSELRVWRVLDKP